MALTDKLTALGTAIRAKTHKIRPLTLEQMVEEINIEWLEPGEQKIKDYIKDFYIQDDGNHYNKAGEKVERDGDWDYFDDEPIGPSLSKGPVIYSYTPEGHIVLTARPNSENYENVEWNLAYAPEGSGIYMYRRTFSSGWNVTGNSDKYESCIITGVNQNCQIFIDCGSKDGGDDSIILNVHIYYDYL